MHNLFAEIQTLGCINVNAEQMRKPRFRDSELGNPDVAYAIYYFSCTYLLVSNLDESSPSSALVKGIPVFSR